MKRFIYAFLILLVYACNTATSQQTDDLKREEDFLNAIKNAKETTQAAQAIQRSADEKTQRAVENAANTIVSLKKEVQELKQDLNEANKKLDSIGVDRGIKFDIRPISGIEEDRQ